MKSKTICFKNFGRVIWELIKRMKINLEWLEKQKNPPDPSMKPDPYVRAILKVGEKVLDLMEALGDKPIDADELVSQADKELDEGITGNMAAYVASIAIKCHSRGDEFRKSWNIRHSGKEGEPGKVVNPAIFTIRDEKS